MTRSSMALASHPLDLGGALYSLHGLLTASGSASLKARCLVKRIFVRTLAELTNLSLRLQNGTQPVKQRRALLASNPLRNSRSEADRYDSWGGFGSPLLRFSNSFPMPEKRAEQVGEPRVEPSAYCHSVLHIYSDYIS
jgi:hypothetical protein